jgi:hypothetical protein
MGRNILIEVRVASTTGGDVAFSHSLNRVSTTSRTSNA